MEKQRLFLDMDGTLARFHDQVNFLERMFEKDFFRNLLPFENMVQGVSQFIKSHPEIEVYILSAKVLGEPPYCESEKHTWLDIYLPEIPRERRIFTEIGRPKSAFIPGGITKNDYLLDDYNRGLNQWLYDGGKAVKCHNNINQRGLGAYGGKSGNLWIGPMVHVDDEPEMICAELEQHMGLSYDLSLLCSVYDIRLSDKMEFPLQRRLWPLGDGRFGWHNPSENGSPMSYSDHPLNVIRYLSGQSLFKDESVFCKERNTHLTLPVFQLQAICSNLYGDPDYGKIRLADSEGFARDIQKALSLAEQPIVGQVRYLSFNGKVMEHANFHSFDEMNREIEDCQDCGHPIEVVWDISPPQKQFNEMCFDEVADIFYFDLQLDADQSSTLAQALLTPQDSRNKEETLALASFWHHTDTSSREILLKRLGADVESYFVPSDNAATLKPDLDSLIHLAQQQTPSGEDPPRAKDLNTR